MFKDINDSKSLYEEKENNKTCRRCLKQMTKYYYKHLLKKSNK